MVAKYELKISDNEFVKNKFNTKLLKSLVLILLFVLLVGINNTYVYYTNLTPFGVGIVLALLFINFNGYILSILYCLSKLLFNFGVVSAIQTVNVVFVLALVFYLKTKNKIKINKLTILVIFLLSVISYIIIGFGDVKENLSTIVSVVLGVFFLYSSVSFLDATIGKCMLGHISLDEKIYGCIILIIFSIGISCTNISILSLGLMFSTVIIQVVCRLGCVSVTLMCGVLIGIGYAVNYLNPIYISLFVVLCLCAVGFKCNNKYFSIIAYVLGYVLFCLLFKMGISVGEIISVLAGSVLSIIIPNKFLNNFADIFEKTKPVAIENIFNNVKIELKNRIKELSVVFGEMDKVYRSMVKGGLVDNEVKEILKEETILTVCNKCPNFNKCFRSIGSYMDSSFDAFINMAFDKGKLLIVDLPEYVTSNCTCVNSIVQNFNNLLSSYLDYEGAVNNLDTSRVLIADQLCGVSRLLETLSNEVDVNISTESKFENIIKERLGYAGIICLECVIYGKNINFKTINLIVKNTHVNDNKIEKIVSKTLNTKYKIVKIDDCRIVGATCITLETTPNYDIAFGSATRGKMGVVVSGDNHSVIPIGEGKYIVSICDGMGSGKKANDISALTLSLIEKFYKAGFDNDIILSSVNKLLSLNEIENYSTIDLCMIDCRKNIYDFVKLGACNGYLKRATGEVEIIESSNLPVGVIENIKPHITKSYVSPMDIVVLVSDGVSDVLGDGLADIIKFSDNINPQTLSEEVLSIALNKNGGVSKDDMTVVCVRVFEYV